MASCFTRFLHRVTKGSLEKELYWWDIFYRYEAHIGVLFAIILSAPFYSLLIYYFICNYHFKEGAEIYGYLIVWVSAIFLTTNVGVHMIVGPSHPKDGNVGQGGLLISTCFGYIGSFIVHFLPLLILLLILYQLISDKILPNVNIFLYIFIIYYVIYYATLFWLKRNIRDYVNWRFDWAIENYNNLLSGHDVWWTSFVQRSVQRQHMKYFRSYKRNASIVTIMTPMLLSLPLLCFAEIMSPSLTDTISGNKVEEVQGNTTNPFDSNIIDDSNTINMLLDSLDSPNLLEGDIDLESEESLSLDLRDIELSADNSDDEIVSDGKEASDEIKETTTNEGFDMIIFERKLNEIDIDNMTKREMYIFRNMIYAHHGYIFKTVELQEYFSKFSWYKPITDDASAVHNELSEVEKYNVDFIKKHE